MAIAGINLFHDYQTKSAHKRLSLGLEYQRTNFHANVNAYHARSDNNTTSGTARSGYDIRLTGQAPYLPWAKIKATHYYWDKTDAVNSRDIKGNVLGIEVKLTPSISFEFGQQNSNTTSPKSYGKLSVKLPFDDKQPLTHFAISDTPFKASSQMDLGALAWVERDNKIQVDGDECSSMVAGGITYSVVAIGTQCWTAENMKHTVTIGNALSYNNDVNNDANGYGKLYDWEAAMAGATTEGAQGICASGWHIPLSDDFEILKDYLGINTAGTQLKEGGGSGFEGLLAGSYANFGGVIGWDFGNRSINTIFLTSTSIIPHGLNQNKTYSLHDTKGVMYNNQNSKAWGYSVRCLQD